MTTFSITFWWLRFLWHFYDYVFYDIFMTVFYYICLCLRFLWYFNDYVFYDIFTTIFLIFFGILYINFNSRKLYKTSSSCLILFFPSVFSSCVSLCSTFIGSGVSSFDGSVLNNNNTNRLEIKIKKTISESLLKPTRGYVLRHQGVIRSRNSKKGNTTPCSNEKTTKRKPDYSKLYTEY